MYYLYYCKIIFHKILNENLQCTDFTVNRFPDAGSCAMHHVGPSEVTDRL